MKTRESKKMLYSSNFIEMYKKEMEETGFTTKSQDKWIEKSACISWEERKKDIENKADALMYGIIDAKARAKKTKELINKALN